MKHTLSLFLFLIIFSFGCSQKESSLEKKIAQNQVTLIFKNPERNHIYYIPDTDSQTVTNIKATQGFPIEGIDDQNLLRYYGFDHTLERDTLVIPTKRDLLELKFVYRGIDRLTYHFQNGDSVLIEYIDSRPYATILNRAEDYAVTNYQLLRRDSIHQIDFLPESKFSNYSFTINSWLQENKRTGKSIDLKDFEKKFKSEQIDEMISQIKIDRAYLADLVEEGKLSKAQESAIINDSYWSIRKAFENEKMEFEGNKIQSSLYEIESSDSSLTIRNDSKLSSINYQKYFREIASKTYKPEMLKIETKGSGSRINNYISLYDSVRNSPLFTPSEKLVLQYTYIDQILANPSFFELEDRLVYLTRFKNDFQDTALFNQLVAKYDVKFEIDDNIELIDAAGTETTLESFVANHKGKVIYLDFWASWCGPCIKEIPASKALKSELKDREVEFLYLSTDRRNKAWKEAQEKHQFTGENHYRITNANNSLAMNELNVIFIPHYMIFGKNGELVNNDAPRPSDKDNLLKELNKYLDQE